MDEERKHPCTVKDGNFVEPCTALAECVAGTAFDKRKGVVEWNYINMSNGQLSRRFYGIRSGAHADKGLVFNYCPFCATKIDTPIAPDEAPVAQLDEQRSSNSPDAGSSPAGCAISSASP